jgi:PEP-CTERM motif
MIRMKLLFPLAALVLAPAAFAGSYSLNEWCFYVNSLDLNHSCAEAGGGGTLSAPFQSASFDPSSGGSGILGTVSVTLTPSSTTYKVFALWDYNSSSGGYNEYATAVGTLPAGESYSVDAPSDPGSGGATPSSPGNLTTYFNSGVLDDTNHLPACSSPPCTDVAVGLEQDVNVAPGTTDTVSFTVSTTPPTSGFYIQQTDANGNTLFFSSTVVDPPLGDLQAIPEPGSIALIAGGLGLLALVRRRRTA